MITLAAMDITPEVMARWEDNAQRARLSGVEAVRRTVDAHMRLYHRKPLADMAIADVPGCWHDRAAITHPGPSLRGCLFCSGAFIAQYRYLDRPRDAITGRFASPYRSWRVLRAAELTS